MIADQFVVAGAAGERVVAAAEIHGADQALELDQLVAEEVPAEIGGAAGVRHYDFAAHLGRDGKDVVAHQAVVAAVAVELVVAAGRADRRYELLELDQLLEARAQARHIGRSTGEQRSNRDTGDARFAVAYQAVVPFATAQHIAAPGELEAADQAIDLHQRIVVAVIEQGRSRDQHRTADDAGHHHIVIADQLVVARAAVERVARADHVELAHQRVAAVAKERVLRPGDRQAAKTGRDGRDERHAVVADQAVVAFTAVQRVNAGGEFHRREGTPAPQLPLEDIHRVVEVARNLCKPCRQRRAGVGRGSDQREADIADEQIVALAAVEPIARQADRRLRGQAPVDDAEVAHRRVELAKHAVEAALERRDHDAVVADQPVVASVAEDRVIAGEQARMATGLGHNAREYRLLAIEARRARSLVQRRAERLNLVHALRHHGHQRHDD